MRCLSLSELPPYFCTTGCMVRGYQQNSAPPTERPKVALCMAKARENSIGLDAVERPAAATPRLLPARRVWLGFAALMLGLFSILSAATSVSSAIPDIQHSFHASLTQ